MELCSLVIKGCERYRLLVLIQRRVISTDEMIRKSLHKGNFKVVVVGSES